MFNSGCIGIPGTAANRRHGHNCDVDANYASQPSRESTGITFVNRSDNPVKVYWLNFRGERILYKSLPPGGQLDTADIHRPQLARYNIHRTMHWDIRDCSRSQSSTQNPWPLRLRNFRYTSNPRRRMRISCGPPGIGLGARTPTTTIGCRAPGRLRRSWDISGRQAIGWCGVEGFAWRAGYWGPHVGFYGGINYGHGYFGRGYVGGSWRDGRMMYNSAVTNLGNFHSNHIYSQPVANGGSSLRASYGSETTSTQCRRNCCGRRISHSADDRAASARSRSPHRSHPARQFEQRPCLLWRARAARREFSNPALPETQHAGTLSFTHSAPPPRPAKDPAAGTRTPMPPQPPYPRQLTRRINRARRNRRSLPWRPRNRNPRQRKINSLRLNHPRRRLEP